MSGHSRRGAGVISEVKVYQKLLSLGYDVFESRIPLPYDFVIRCKSGWAKLQVKTCLHGKRYGRKSIELGSRPNGKWRSYSASDVDFFVGVYGQNFYVVPFAKAVAGSNTVNYYMDHSDLERWDLLPEPHGQQESIVDDVARQQELGVV